MVLGLFMAFYGVLRILRIQGRFRTPPEVFKDVQKVSGGFWTV